MRKPTNWAFAVAVLSAGACVPEAKEPKYKGQSYEQAIRTMCNADELAGIAQEGDPVEKARKREEFMKERIENPDAIYFATLLKVQSPNEQSRALEKEACASAIKNCPLADELAAVE